MATSLVNAICVFRASRSSFMDKEEPGLLWTSMTFVHGWPANDRCLIQSTMTIIMERTCWVDGFNLNLKHSHCAIHFAAVVYRDFVVYVSVVWISDTVQIHVIVGWQFWNCYNYARHDVLSQGKVNARRVWTYKEVVAYVVWVLHSFAKFGNQSPRHRHSSAVKGKHAYLHVYLERGRTLSQEGLAERRIPLPFYAGPTVGRYGYNLKPISKAHFPPTPNARHDKNKKNIQ